MTEEIIRELRNNVIDNVFPNLDMADKDFLLGLLIRTIYTILAKFSVNINNQIEINPLLLNCFILNAISD